MALAHRRIAFSASVLLPLGSMILACSTAATLAACSGDDDDDTYGIDGGNYVYDATTDASGSDAAATDAGDAQVDAAVTCPGVGGFCSLSSAACIDTDASTFVGIPATDNSCAASGFGASSVCCTSACGSPPMTACHYGAVSYGPPYCQNGVFVCPDGTIVSSDGGTTDAGTDSGAVDAGNDAGSLDAAADGG